MNSQKKVILPIVLLFVFVNAFLLTSSSFITKWGADKDVLIVANIICFVINLLAFLLQSKSLQNANPNAFVRAVMGGVMLKMLVCIFAVFIYVMSAKEVNKPAVIISMALYILYMAIEIAAILKLNKQKNG
ncbi:MAG: hypothetical protein IPP48_13590 [Chitinophagaceae bacterium]|nr:hypothetical protein [Chitinophagaceae bacterium]